LADYHGRVTQVRVLEAPDAAIREAVESTVRRWTFASVQPDGAIKATRIQGKLTFYFHIRDGAAAVENPAAAQALKPTGHRVVRPPGNERSSRGQ
jgi:hypothetical protein